MAFEITNRLFHPIHQTRYCNQFLNELIASETRASPVSLNEGTDLLHPNEEILRCALLDFQETTRNEFN